MLIDERLDAGGALHRLTLRRDGEHLVLEEDGAALGPLPAVAVRAVMQRYGRPLDAGVVMEALPGAELPFGDDRLRRMRYRAAVDAIGRDYLVWEQRGQEPVAALSITVAAALRHLATAPRR